MPSPGEGGGGWQTRQLLPLPSSAGNNFSALLKLRDSCKNRVLNFNSIGVCVWGGGGGGRVCVGGGGKPTTLDLDPSLPGGTGEGGHRCFGSGDCVSTKHPAHSRLSGS